MSHKRIVLDNDAPLRSAREALGLTQEEAAEASGLKRSAIGNAERRGGGITVGTLTTYLSALGRRLQIVALDEKES
jgi:transcriptional regulator with XRE-family HTH domain